MAHKLAEDTLVSTSEPAYKCMVGRVLDVTATGYKIEFEAAPQNVPGLHFGQITLSFWKLGEEHLLKVIEPRIPMGSKVSFYDAHKNKTCEGVVTGFGRYTEFKTNLYKITCKHANYFVHEDRVQKCAS